MQPTNRVICTTRKRVKGSYINVCTHATEEKEEQHFKALLIVKTSLSRISDCADMFQLVAVIPKRVSQSKECVLQPEFEGLLLYQVNKLQTSHRPCKPCFHPLKIPEKQTKAPNCLQQECKTNTYIVQEMECMSRKKTNLRPGLGIGGLSPNLGFNEAIFSKLHIYNCKSLPFFYFLTFEKADCSIFTLLSVGWLVGRLVGRHHD